MAEVEAALYEERSLVKPMAMRRTLFVVTRDLLPAVAGQAGRRVAEAERRRLAKEAGELSGSSATDGSRRRRGEIVACLTGRELSARELRAALPHLGGTFTAAPGTKWSAEVPTISRLLTVLTAAGRRRAGPQRRPLAQLPAAVDVDGELARRRADTHRARRRVRRDRPALAVDVRARDGGRSRLVARVDEDRGPHGAVRSSTRSPSSWRTGRRGGCCPTTPRTWRRRRASSRGWRCCRRSTRRRWAGGSGRSTSTRRTRRTCSTRPATAGRRCGWTAGSSGAGCRTNASGSRLVLIEEVSRDTRRLLDAEAARLDEFLGGEHITNVFASPQMKRQRIS